MSQSKWRRLPKWTAEYIAEAKKRATNTPTGFYYNHPRSNPKPTPRGEGWPQEQAA